MSRTNGDGAGKPWPATATSAIALAAGKPPSDGRRWPDAATSTITPAAFTVTGACQYSSLNRTALYAAFANGLLQPRKIGRRTLVMREDLDRMLASLPRADIRVGRKAADPLHTA